MKKLMSLAAVAMFAVSVFAQRTLVSDPAHSRMQFEVTHLGINDITGNFDTVSLTLNTNDKNFVDSKFSFKADINSIDTHVEARDNHLKSADFFDAAQYPELTFTTTSIAKTKTKNVYTLSGNLSFHGVTKPVTVKLIYKGSVVNPMSKANTYSYQFVGTLKRSDFGVGPKFPEAMISDEVRIKGDFELGEQK
ncbi:YceI family protein [Weeksellaceae bacterium A-14]|uniref:YceI family protein n=1 Tax=Daejeonia sp. YH14 TaxID=3439042 RepID=UPI0031E4A46A